MNTNLLSTGIYSIPMAARLLEVNPTNLRGWLRGYRGMVSSPLIPSDLASVSNNFAMSFVNLIEARFIGAFANLGVSVRAIRYMAEEAKRFLNHPHPFATEMMFRTDGKKIFIRSADETGDPILYDLKGKNWAIDQVLRDAFKTDVLYGASGLAEIWYPRKGIAPDVVLHPKISFGQPVIFNSGIPTEALYDAFIAEDKNYANVARWFDVPISGVKEAVKFEVNLKALH